MKINITPYWDSIISYYENDIQKYGTISVWPRLEEDYNAKCSDDWLAWARHGEHKGFLIFESDEDLVAFKLKFNKVCIERC